MKCFAKTLFASMAVLLASLAAHGADATNTTDIDADTLAKWSAPFRGWTYWPEHVIPNSPPLPGATNVLGTDVPTVFQIPDDEKFYMSFVAFDGKGYQSYIAESTNLVDWSNYRLGMGYGPTNEFDN